MNIYKKIFNEIKKNKKIIITTHIRADGDCVGSAIGLKEMIKAMYKDKIVLATYESISYLPYLPKCDEISDEDFKDALVISVDNADLSRANDNRINTASKIIKIDHHPNRNLFGYINFVEEEKCACAEMIFDFLTNIKHSAISILGLTAIFTGIMTDSGRLKYSGVTGDTYKKIGLMVDMGVDREVIFEALDKVTLTELKFKGFIFDNMKTTEHGLLYVKIKSSDREKYDIKYDEASNMVGELASVEGYPVWALFNEYKEDEVRCRIRSSRVVINDIAESFGGGGHAFASGIVTDSFGTVDKIIEAIDNKLKNLN